MKSPQIPLVYLFLIVGLSVSAPTESPQSKVEQETKSEVSSELNGTPENSAQNNSGSSEVQENDGEDLVAKQESGLTVEQLLENMGFGDQFLEQHPLMKLLVDVVNDKEVKEKLQAILDPMMQTEEGKTLIALLPMVQLQRNTMEEQFTKIIKKALKTQLLKTLDNISDENLGKLFKNLRGGHNLEAL